MSSVGTIERNILLALCALFSLSAFGFAGVNPLFFAGLVGWILAGFQTIRLHGLKNDPAQKPQGQVIDIIFTGLITLFLASVVYSAIIFFRTVGPAEQVPAGQVGIEAAQMMLFAGLVLIGGWVLSWVQGVRRLRLNMRLTDGSGH